MPGAPESIQSSLRNRHFQDKIRPYNASLAFALLGANKDVLQPGVFCYRINGDIHHQIGHELQDSDDALQF